MELLDRFFSNLVLEIDGCLWCFCWKHHLVETSPLPVSQINANLTLHILVCLSNNPINLVQRIEGEAYVQYKAMIITLALQILLLMFELLICDNLESPQRHSWILVFIPLIFISIISIAICIWAVKNDRSFDVSGSSSRLNLIIPSFQLTVFIDNFVFVAGVILLRQHTSIYILGVTLR